jgi:hypothetical protein
MSKHEKVARKAEKIKFDSSLECLSQDLIPNQYHKGRHEYVSPVQLPTEETVSLIESTPLAWHAHLRRLLIENGNKPTALPGRINDAFNKRFFTRPLNGRYFRMLSGWIPGGELRSQRLYYLQLWETKPKK